MPEPHDDPLQPSETPDEYPLAPQVEPLLPAPMIEPDEPRIDSESNQFTLGELLGLVTAMVVLLSVIGSVARWTSMGTSPATFAAAYAGVLGFGALASMIALTWMPQARRIVVVGWWALWGLYVVTAIAAFLMSK